MYAFGIVHVCGRVYVCVCVYFIYGMVYVCVCVCVFVRFVRGCGVLIGCCVLCYTIILPLILVNAFVHCLDSAVSPICM